MSFRYFLSGVPGIRGDLVPECASFITHRLLSMDSSFKSNTKTWCAVSHHEKSSMTEIMLDSGAYTAFMHGKKVELNELIASYDAAIRSMSKKIRHVWIINLDVIPGAFGRVAEMQEVQQALDESDDNYRLLRKRYGAERVLPVYHQTESSARLRTIVGMAPFIALGFRQDFAEEHRIACAEEALSYAHSKGALVHGLATTGTRMLRRAPFDTVDSASWLYAAAMGKVLYLDERGELQVTPISSLSPLQREPRAHFISLTEPEKQFIVARLAEAGVRLEQAQNDLSYRIIANAYAMREWIKGYRRPTIRQSQGLFPL